MRASSSATPEVQDETLIQNALEGNLAYFVTQDYSPQKLSSVKASDGKNLLHLAALEINAGKAPLLLFYLLRKNIFDLRQRDDDGLTFFDYIINPQYYNTDYREAPIHINHFLLKEIIGAIMRSMNIAAREEDINTATSIISTFVRNNADIVGLLERVNPRTAGILLNLADKMWLFHPEQTKFLLKRANQSKTQAKAEIRSMEGILRQETQNIKEARAVAAMKSDEFDFMKKISDKTVTDFAARFNTTPLHIAAYNGYLNAVHDLLQEDPSLLNRTNKNGGTPLHNAAILIERFNNHYCKVKKYEIAQMLMAQGCDVNAKDKFGATALHYAARCGFLPLVQSFVIERDGDLESDSFKETGVPYPQTPYICALVNGHNDTANFLVTKLWQRNFAQEDGGFLYEEELQMVNATMLEAILHLPDVEVKLKEIFAHFNFENSKMILKSLVMVGITNFISEDKLLDLTRGVANEDAIDDFLCEQFANYNQHIEELRNKRQSLDQQTPGSHVEGGIAIRSAGMVTTHNCINPTT